MHINPWLSEKRNDVIHVATVYALSCFKKQTSEIAAISLAVSALFHRSSLGSLPVKVAKKLGSDRVVRSYVVPNSVLWGL